MNWGTRIAAGFMLSLAGLVWFGPVHSMGLGEARVDSFLNQPLDVRIRLLEVRAADLDSLTVQMGNADAYQQLGLMSDVLALGISVTIDRTQRPAMLRVRSERPVTDPVIQLLIDARWSSGRILREYTLFLDPATIPAAPPVAVPTPQAQAPAVVETRSERAAQATIPSARETMVEPEPQDSSVTVAESESAEQAAPPDPVSEAEPEAAGVEQETGPEFIAEAEDQVQTPVPDEPEPAIESEQPSVSVAVRTGNRGSYTVMPGDTLWAVARDVRGDSGLSMDQTMLAIVDLNPSAFRNGSIHRMLSGANLELPDRDQIASIDRQFARQTVAMQNRAFNQGLEAPVTVVADAEPVRLDVPETVEAGTTDPASATRTGEEPEVATNEAAADDFRLELVPPLNGDEGLGLAAEQQDANRMRQQLARTEEELFTAQLEAEDFRNRLDELEGMVNDNPGGIGIQDFDLAQLEQTLRAAREANVADPLDSELRNEVSDQLDAYLEQFSAAPDSELMADATDQTIASSSNTETVNEQPPPEPVVTQVGEPRSGLFANPVLLGSSLFALIVVIGLIWFVIRHIREVDDAPVERVPAKMPVEPHNPLQAAESAVRSNPDDLGAHLALLKALDGRQDNVRFSEALDSMYAHVDYDEQPLWLEALALAAAVVPDHPLIQGSIDWVAGSDDSDNDRDADIDELMARMEDSEESEASDATNDSVAPSIEDAADSGPLPADEPVSPDPSEVSEFVADEMSGEEDAVDPNAESLSFDWPEAGEGDALSGESDAALNTESPIESEAAETEDIFGATDDDIDVKLDLAKAYLSWNSIDSARTLLEEVIREGNQHHQEQAKKLLDDL